jgi:hypothetical protein
MYHKNCLFYVSLFRNFCNPSYYMTGCHSMDVLFYVLFCRFLLVLMQLSVNLIKVLLPYDSAMFYYRLDAQLFLHPQVSTS